MSGLFAEHGIICASQGALKKCDEAQVFGKSINEEASLSLNFREISVLEVNDEPMLFLICVLFVRCFFA